MYICTQLITAVQTDIYIAVMASTTTRGAQSIEWLCNEIQREDGERKYVCDQSCLVNLAAIMPRTEDAHKEAIIARIGEIFQYIETQTDKEIQLFYVGKTYVRRKHKQSGFITFDAMNPNTWKKEGIISRWGKHSVSPHGKDGMIVLTIVTREVMPSSYTSQEQYTLQLEKMLMYHYDTCMKDKRFANPSLAPGNTDRNQSYGYALYVTVCMGNKK